MLTNYTMQPQGKHEELCKQLTKCCVLDAATGNTSFPPIKFPCLRVQLGAPNDDGKFVVTWSHFNHIHKLETNGHDNPNKGTPITSENPGKFKLRRVELVRPMYYERDQNTNRIVYDRRGNKMFDFVRMASEWGTEAELIGRKLVWTYGPDHPMVEETMHEVEFETVEGLHAELTSQFGEELANDVCLNIVGHELYQKYDTTYQDSGADGSSGEFDLSVHNMMCNVAA